MGWWVYPLLYGNNGSWSTLAHMFVLNGQFCSIATAKISTCELLFTGCEKNMRKKLQLTCLKEDFFKNWHRNPRYLAWMQQINSNVSVCHSRQQLLSTRISLCLPHSWAYSKKCHITTMGHYRIPYLKQTSFWKTKHHFKDNHISEIQVEILQIVPPLDRHLIIAVSWIFFWKNIPPVHQ